MAEGNKDSYPLRFHAPSAGAQWENRAMQDTTLYLAELTIFL